MAYVIIDIIIVFVVIVIVKVNFNNWALPVTSIKKMLKDIYLLKLNIIYC